MVAEAASGGCERNIGRLERVKFQCARAGESEREVRIVEVRLASEVAARQQEQQREER